MAAPLRRMLCQLCKQITIDGKCLGASVVLVRHSNTLPNRTVEKHRKSSLGKEAERPDEEDLESADVEAPRDYKYVYPDFLPNPVWYYRDRIKEKLERRDMLRRRKQIDIPEFYVGTVMAVTATDPFGPNKRNRFVGICIQRAGHGLTSNFTLRNVVDGLGCEVRYELYSPMLQRIEVLRLEKRLDEELFYLRDAPLEYSTIPFDMPRVPHPPGAPVPVNTTKVKLGPRPWHERWERKELKGVEDLGLPQKFYDRAKEVAQPWEKYDMMKKYRKEINDDDVDFIMKRVHRGLADKEENSGKHKK